MVSHNSLLYVNVLDPRTANDSFDTIAVPPLEGLLVAWFHALHTEKSNNLLIPDTIQSVHCEFTTL